METLFTVLIVIALVGWALNRVTKTGQQIVGAARGENRSKCAYCGKGLKSHPNRLGYADYCSRCGRQQPWAERASP